MFEQVFKITVLRRVWSKRSGDRIRNVEPGVTIQRMGAPKKLFGNTVDNNGSGGKIKLCIYWEKNAKFETMYLGIF